MSNENTKPNTVPTQVQEAVLVKSDTSIVNTQEVISGYDFNNGIDFDALLKSYKYIGFQASNFAKAVDEVNKMIHWRLSDEPMDEDEVEPYNDPKFRSQVKCTIFLGYTSNMISCGVREIIRFLVQHKMVQCIVTTAGGIEEDFIKCMAPTFLGDFELQGKMLRQKGINRIGNLLVPNDNYCKFEDWIVPILDQMLHEQTTQGVNWTPSKIIARLGKEINHPDSVYYWAYKNNIPVFCPALTDGSIGDMIYFHSYKSPGFRVDLVEDIRMINDMAVRSKRTGMIILGGGVVKHHIFNANLMRNGADYTVLINTAQEFDGSDSGARPDESISWGKIRSTGSAVKVYGEATLIFPLLVAQTFAKEVEKQNLLTANKSK
jgi:deoxyhypusine synthase